MLSVKQGSIKYHFLVFGMARPGIETTFPGPLANTLTINPIMYTLFIFVYTHVYVCMRVSVDR